MRFLYHKALFRVLRLSFALHSTPARNCFAPPAFNNGLFRHSRQFEVMNWMESATGKSNTISFCSRPEVMVPGIGLIVEK